MVLILDRRVWRARERMHAARTASLSSAYRLRREQGRKHPVEDFLWTYYSTSPATLARWHPGAGMALQGGATERREWKYYAIRDADALVNLPAYFARRGGTVDYIERLLTATLERTPAYNCFGLHEWAMVHGQGPDSVRHVGLPLRIGHEATDAVVETHRIACSHFDAYRFFTPSAAPLNALSPTRETQPELEQAGCLHAGMDVYKWAAKLGPIIPGELLLDAFEFARDVREVDMRASPYDVSGFAGCDGKPLAPIAIETDAGKAEYALLQRGFAERGNGLRRRVLDAIHRARSCYSARGSESSAI